MNLVKGWGEKCYNYVFKSTLYILHFLVKFVSIDPIKLNIIALVRGITCLDHPDISRLNQDKSVQMALHLYPLENENYWGEPYRSLGRTAVINQLLKGLVCGRKEHAEFACLMIY